MTFPAAVGTIAGTARDTTDGVVPNPYVYGYQNVTYTGGAYLAANTSVAGDASGNFALPVSAGNWRLYAYNYSGYAQSPYVDADAPASGVILRLLRLNGCIQGRINFPRATPSGGTSYVYAYNFPVTTTPSAYYFQYGYPDATGRYSLPAGPGEWWVAAAGTDFVAAATIVAQLPPDATNVDFNLMSRTYLPAGPRNLGGW